MNDETVLLLLKHVDAEADLYHPAWFWRTIIYTLYFTGMRRKQLVFLRLQDIDFARGAIFLRAQGSKTLRTWEIPLHPLLCNELQKYLRYVKVDIGRDLVGKDALFNIVRHNSKFKSCSVNKDQMPSVAITDFFKRVNKRTQLSVSAHKFRHTLATKLCNPDIGEPDLFVVQQLLGHTMIQTTRLYVKTSLGRMNCAMDKITLP